MSRVDLGPRRQGLLEAWGEFAATSTESEFHDFRKGNRNARVRSRLDAFLDAPTREKFEALWSREVLRDSVMGGSGLVLNTWPGTTDDLADRFREMQRASEYDPAWEDDIVTKTALWELYGHMNPESRPILNSKALSGLSSLGFDTISEYRSRDSYERFADAYESIVGHATAGTDHEVPWHFELEQFLVMIGTETRYDIYDELSIEQDYPKVVGWEAEGDAGKIVFQDLGQMLDKYVEYRAQDGDKEPAVDVWGGNYWESWKWTHADHIETNVTSRFDITDLDASEVEPFLEAFKTAPDVELSSAVPTYLLGGRSGGILWSEFKNRSVDHPEAAAEVLSSLFDESQQLSNRLARFREFYDELNTSPGPLLSLATLLLMLTYPEDYVMYKYGKFSAFFGEYSDYTVSTGFDPEQYWVLNEAGRRLVRRLDEAFEADIRIDADASMLDVHTLIWVSVGVEDL